MYVCLHGYIFLLKKISNTGTLYVYIHVYSINSTSPSCYMIYMISGTKSLWRDAPQGKQKLQLMPNNNCALEGSEAYRSSCQEHSVMKPNMNHLAPTFIISHLKDQ